MQLRSSNFVHKCITGGYYLRIKIIIILYYVERQHKNHSSGAVIMAECGG